jgi:hypothetical protein
MNTPDANLPTPPDRWLALFTAADWRRGAAAIGEDRLDELHPMLEQVSPAFRARFLDHLVELGPTLPAGRAVLLALARASHDAAEQLRARRPR